MRSSIPSRCATLFLVILSPIISALNTTTTATSTTSKLIGSNITTSTSSTVNPSSITATSTAKTTTTTTVSTTSFALNAVNTSLATTTSSSSSSSSLHSTRTTTTAAPSNTCAIKYIGGQGRTITGTGTLPKPTSFIAKSSSSNGQGLFDSLSGNAFRIAGINMYWLCQDENVPGVIPGTPTSKTRIREALAIAVAMGANTIRIISCGTSVGTPYSIESSLNKFGNWDSSDYVIFAAREYGLRVVLPLTDNYDYYHGGKYTFLRWLGVSLDNYGIRFYNNTSVIRAYTTYIRAYLNHVNVYTGVAYKNDPTILAYETGNELGAYIGKEGYPPAHWTTTISGLIKSLTKSLVIDGSNGFYNYTTKATAPGLNVANIDIMSDHGYPRNVALLQSEIPLASRAKKGFLVGEYDWTNSFGGDSLSSYLSYLESFSYIGDMMWNVMGHDDQCCQYISHTDGYSVYYPNGNTKALQTNLLQIVKHLYRMTGRSGIANTMRSIPAVSCPQPVF